MLSNRRIYTFILFCCITILVQPAQAQKWTVSETMKLDQTGYFKILGKINSDYKLVKVYPNHVDLFTFNQDLKVKYYRPIDILQEEQQVHRVFERDSTFDILYSIIRTDSIHLILSRYDYEGDIQRATILKRYPISDGRPELSSMLSDNSEWLTLSTMRQGDLFEIMIIFNNDLRLVRDDVFGLSQFELGGFPPDVHVTNTGRTFILVESREEIDRRPRQFISVIQIFMDVRETKIVELDFGNAIVDYPYYYWDNENFELNVFGFYRAAYEFETRGVCHVSLNESFDSLPNITLSPFSGNLLQQYYEKTKHPIPGIPDLQVVNLIEEPNGDFTIFAEIRTKYYHSDDAYNPFMRGASNNIDYYYDEIIVFRTSNKGEIKWYRMLSKKHHSFNDNAVHSSFVTVNQGEKYRLIHNQSTKRNSSVLEYVITDEGEVSQRSLFEERRHPLRLHITSAVMIDKNELLIPSVYRRNVNIVRLELD